MDNNLNMTGQDRLDALLFDIAEEENMKVDYAAMLDTVYKKAAARKKRTAFVKYGSMAAAAAIALAVGGLWFAMARRLIRTKPHRRRRSLCAARQIAAAWKRRSPWMRRSLLRLMRRRRARAI